MRETERKSGKVAEWERDEERAGRPRYEVR